MMSPARVIASSGVLVLTAVTLAVLGRDWSGSVTPSTASCNIVTIFGLKTADCVGLGLETIPKALDRDLKVLKLTENQLSSLRTDDFQNYIYLQEIYIVRNVLEMIYSNAFRGLYSLQILDLEGNRLRMIRSYFFLGIGSVRILSLKSNPIQRIDANSFSPLVNLEELSLENCWITQFDPLLLKGLDNLNEVNLVNTELHGLSAEMERHIPRSLRVFRLWKNSWQCDCHLRWLRQWVTASSVNWDFPHNTPSCFGPEILRGVQWKHLTPEQFACPSKILVNSSTSIQVLPGTNVTVDCVVTGDPEPTVFWYKDDVAVEKSFTLQRRHKSESSVRSSLLLSSVAPEDTGDYKCVAENPAGRSEVTFRIWMEHYLTPTAATESTGNLLSDRMEIFLGIAIGGGVLVTGLIVCALCMARRVERGKNQVYRSRGYKENERGEKVTDNGNAGKTTAESLCDNEDDESAKEDTLVDMEKCLSSTLQTLLISSCNSRERNIASTASTDLTDAGKDPGGLDTSPQWSKLTAVGSGSSLQKPVRIQDAAGNEATGEGRQESWSHQSGGAATSLKDRTPDLLSYDRHALSDVTKGPNRVRSTKVSFAENADDVTKTSSMKRAQENLYSRFTDCAKNPPRGSSSSRDKGGMASTDEACVEDHSVKEAKGKVTTIADCSGSQSKSSDRTEDKATCRPKHCDAAADTRVSRGKLDLIPVASCPSLPKISLVETPSYRTKAQTETTATQPRKLNPAGKAADSSSLNRRHHPNDHQTFTCPERWNALYKSRSHGTLHTRASQPPGRWASCSSKSVRHQMCSAPIALPASIVGITEGLYPLPPCGISECGQVQTLCRRFRPLEGGKAGAVSFHLPTRNDSALKSYPGPHEDDNNIGTTV